MKPANIVQAMNKVLSDTYWCNCTILELRSDVADVFGSYGRYTTHIQFKSDKQLTEFMNEEREGGCVLVEEQMQTNGITREWYYFGMLLYGSPLHRKLLKAQLKFITKEV